MLTYIFVLLVLEAWIEAAILGPRQSEHSTLLSTYLKVYS